MVTQSLSDITLSPSEVREILNADNEEIINLCKRASIIPKRNSRGLTYFSYDEVKYLQQIKQTKNNLVRISSNAFVDNIINSLGKMEERISNDILESLDKKIDEKITNNISNTLDSRIEERIQGVEGLASELIEVKTENEKLKNKIIELNRENAHMKMELEKFEKIGFGLYRKYKVKDFTI